VYVVISGIYSADRLDSNVITYSINKLLDGECPSLTKLEQLWDYVHIDDVVMGLRLIIDKGKDNAFYVIGHGDNWPLANYIYKIRDAIDPTLVLGIGDVPYKDGKIPMSCVDLSEMKRDTGFEPKISFEIGILEMIESIKRSRGMIS
jgi:nucleoside-diphosphate-sugar epimerase